MNVTGTFFAILDNKIRDEWRRHYRAGRSYLLTFTNAYITDLEGLLAQIKEPTGEICKYVNQRFLEFEPDIFSGHPPSGRTVASVLNRLIRKGSLFDDSKVDGVSPFLSCMREETKALIQTNPKYLDLIRLNRHILEDAFPNALAQSSYDVALADSREKDRYYTEHSHEGAAFLLREAIACLPKRDQEILYALITGKTHAQIAAEYGKQESTISGWISHIMVELRQILVLDA